MWNYISYDELYHHGIKGQKWGIRRFQNSDGTLTAEGRNRLIKNRNRIEANRTRNAAIAVGAGAAVKGGAKALVKATYKRAINAPRHKGLLITHDGEAALTNAIFKIKNGASAIVSDPLVKGLASSGLRYIAQSQLMTLGLTAIPAALVVSGSAFAIKMISNKLRYDQRLRDDLNEERRIQEYYNIKKKE